MEKLLSQFKEKKWLIMICIGVFSVGIFLRTYQFHDFLRFNADQSRDAGVVGDYIDGASPLPLLGPKAGGTDFRVGPIFYYFQIASAKIFGNEPDVVAYPDLLFSLLVMPLLFFFLRKYFDVRTSLLLTALFAVSLYAVKYSRFAWNPNSLPFWSILFLFSLHEIATAKGVVKKKWAVFAGIALGVGVQLHTLSLIFFPIISVLVFGSLFFQKKMQWQLFFITIGIALLLNTGQIISEIQTGGANTTAFFHGIGTKEKKGGGMANNVLKDIACYTQANAYILSSYDSDDGCRLKSVRKGWNLPVFLVGLIFFIGGIWLALRAFRREQDISRKYFLGIVFAYLALSFFVLLPFSYEISMRFFLAMIFMPFIFLGLWIEYALEKCPKYAEYMVMILVFALMILNLSASFRSFSISKSYLTDSNEGMDNMMLREVELASAFVISHAFGADTIAIDGDQKYLFKGLKSMNYFTSRSGIRLVEKTKKTDPSSPVFLIENTKHTDDILKHREIGEFLSFGRFTIFSLK